MSQTSIIAGSIVVAFIVFAVVNNELPCWLEILGISSGDCCAGINNSGPGGSINFGPGGVTVQPPSVGVGPVIIRPPVIRG